jgi:hypothetical protein
MKLNEACQLLSFADKLLLEDNMNTANYYKYRKEKPQKLYWWR